MVGGVTLCRQQRFPRTRSSVRAARQFAGDTLWQWGIADRGEDIRLCASELAANAVLHGVPYGRDFCVRLVWEEGMVRVEVRDSGPGLPVVGRPGVDALCGRGLWLVSELADDFGVTDQLVGKTVWVRFECSTIRHGARHAPDQG
ncbi:ATP-binding protein [Streptomyces sp. NPDC001594]|uniref:ATP-binding protein n=1 Tax=Streptomyces sp. NPDC001594 TaxID=3364590 RepID=UPI0036749AA7